MPHHTQKSQKGQKNCIILFLEKSSTTFPISKDRKCGIAVTYPTMDFWEDCGVTKILVPISALVRVSTDVIKH